MQNLLILIPIIPLVGALLSFLSGKIDKAVSGWVATLAAFLSFFLVCYFFTGLEGGSVIFKQTLFDWISINDFATSTKQVVQFGLRLDALSMLMCLIITGIGTLIHLYSIGYMAVDPSRPRFFAYLNLFLFFMLLLVLGSNLLMLFIGWEGVGLCSYLLIGFWYKKTDYAKAGRKAFIVNRIGDAAFLIGIFLLFYAVGSIDFLDLAKFFEANKAVSVASIVALCLFIGATGKSAQIPLFVWLPDAMAGPTPVSALIHAATMVTAGLYLMARTHFIFEQAPQVASIIVVVAILTSFIAALTALVQNDIKKVLAYSTVSQLGFMFMAAAAGAYWVAIFHVVTHAFFKACLFLCAGSVIHGCHHEQDMRQMGGLASKMPITFVTYLVATVAISGIFPLSGYQSKHAILGALEHSGFSHWIYYLAMFTAFLTAFYMTRSLIMTFFGKYKGHAHPHESPLTMTIPLIVLACLSVIGGFYLQDRLPEFLSKILNSKTHEHESIFASLLHSWTGLSGIFLAFIMYKFYPAMPEKISTMFSYLHRIFDNKFYFDEVYHLCVVTPLEKIGNFCWKVIDVGFIDSAVNGTGSVVEVTGEISRFFQSGQTRTYCLGILFSTVVVILLCFVF